MPNELTDPAYWEAMYEGRVVPEGLPALDDFRELPFRRIIELIGNLIVPGQSVVEVGAGNSSILLSLASIRSGEYSGLDYSQAGCDSLEKRAAACGISANVVRADIFKVDPKYFNSFDMLYSVGVVEHFVELPEILSAMSRLLKPGGRMISIIPNMRGVIGLLCRRMNRGVYDLHNPHSLASLVEGHTLAGLSVARGGYICSNNFSVLAACADRRKRFAWSAYVALTRISKLVWAVEFHTGDFPKSQLLSPYLYVVAEKLKS